MNEITRVIKAKQAERGFSRRKMSDLTGYEENYLSTLIHGKTNFPYSFLVCISDVLDIDLSQLIKLKNEGNN